MFKQEWDLNSGLLDLSPTLY